MLFLLSTSTLVFANDFWLSASIGGASVSGPAVSVAGSYQLGNYPITLRMGGVSGERDVLEEKVLLIGYRLPGQSKYFSAGISQINGRHRGQQYYDPSNWLGPSYEWDHYETIGLTLEYNAIKSFGSFFGLGFTAGANINKEATYFSCLISLNFGHITD